MPDIEFSRCIDKIYVRSLSNQCIVLFEEIANINIVDVPYTASRKFTKPLDTNDAYIYENGEFSKIKVVY